MATFSNLSKNTSTFANINKDVSASVTIPTGTPMGLLLALTYAAAVTIDTISTPSWANASKNSSSFTNLIKN